MNTEKTFVHTKEYRKDHRHTVEARIGGIPEFEMIGFDTFTKTGSLRTHSHRGSFEFCLILRGHVTWCARKRTYDLQGGDVYFTFPDELHGGLHELMQPCTIYWMVLQAPRPGTRRARSFLQLPPREALALCEALYGMRERHLRGADQLAGHFKTLFPLLLSGQLLDLTRIRAHLQLLLATLVQLPAARDSHGFRPPGILRTRTLLDECPAPWPRVEELAELSGMSISHFHSCFLKETGMAPMEYAHRRRLERARLLLKEPEASITRVAQRLGYCSSQHMATCFKKYLGLTPSQARRGPPGPRR